MRGIFTKEFTEQDAARVYSEFEQSLDQAAARDGGNVLRLAHRVWEYFCSSSAGSNTWMYAGLALLYFISPVDLIPDVTPFLGYVDDVRVLTYALGTLTTGAPYVKKARFRFRHKYGLE